jgi:uncharacterized membrane protein YdjX (TVP38/TMEM64 family)
MLEGKYNKRLKRQKGRKRPKMPEENFYPVVILIRFIPHWPFSGLSAVGYSSSPFHKRKHVIPIVYYNCQGFKPWGFGT